MDAEFSGTCFNSQIENITLSQLKFTAYGLDIFTKRLPII